jgi:hypothetical protein
MSDLIERLEAWIPGCGAEAPMSMEADLRQAVKALEAADRLAEFAEDDAFSRAIVATGARAYRSARSTSTKGDG